MKEVKEVKEVKEAKEVNEVKGVKEGRGVKKAERHEGRRAEGQKGRRAEGQKGRPPGGSSARIRFASTTHWLILANPSDETMATRPLGRVMACMSANMAPQDWPIMMYESFTAS